MPRVKRPLSEADPNASRAPKFAKIAKTSTTNAASADGYESKSREVLVSALRERNIPHTGSRKALIERLRQNDKNANADSNSQPKDSQISSQTLSRRRSTRNTTSNDPQSSGGSFKVETGCDVKPLPKDNPSAPGWEIDYTTKDNGKLVTLLEDRGLLTYGTREEQITRLQTSPFHYESLTSEALSDILKRRQLTMCGTGTKEIKIQRLKLNDELDRDTGNSEECRLYAMVSVGNNFLAEIEELQNALGKDVYSSLEQKQISSILKKRKLPVSRTKAGMIRALKKHDERKLNENLKKYNTKFRPLGLQLESRIGHPVNVDEYIKQEDKQRGRDYELQKIARPKPASFPKCGYDWKDSHWASRTEQELREISSRWEMPGYGSKAAMIKFLDTGYVDYEDLSMGSLESMCRKRGLRVRSNDKKVDLILRLKELDEQVE